eukprot:RCo048760
MPSTSGVSVLTDECASALATLRDLIVGKLESSLERKLLAQLHAVERAFEDQIMCIFANVAHGDKEKQSRLLKKPSPADQLAVSQQESSGHLNPLVAQTSASPRVALAGTTTFASSTRTEKQGRPRKAQPHDVMSKHLTAAIYLLAEAVAARVRAERAVVYIYYRTSNILKSICTVPHNLPKVTVPSHSGTAGLVFSSGVGLSVAVETEEQQPLVKTMDELLGTETKNVLCFPVLDRTLQAVGILECANKTHGRDLWTERDEAVVYHAALILSHLICAYPEVDLLSTPPFDPANSFHTHQSWSLDDNLGLDLGPSFPATAAALDSNHPQLVLRS